MDKSDLRTSDTNPIPIVDFSIYRSSDKKRVQLAKSVRDICHQTGFFIVKNHAINKHIIDQAFEYSRQFFVLPTATKRLIDKRQSPCFRGWECEGAETTNNRADIREQIDLWTEHHSKIDKVKPHYMKLLGPNQWLPENELPGFKTAINQYIDEMKKLADQLMGLLALGLELPESFFENCFGEQRMSLTKLIRYPKTPPGNFGVNAHNDTGFLTILHPGETPGLEIEMAHGSWSPVPVIENTFVINLGEMLQAMTGNYYIATPHRVKTNQQRFSLGYFHGPSLETSIERIPLARKYTDAVAASPRHCSAGFMAPIRQTESGVGDMQGSQNASTFGEQLWHYFCRSYPDNVKLYYPDLGE